MQKYKILIDGMVIDSGYYASVDISILETKVDFLKTKVKDGVKVELYTWAPNR